MKVLITTSDKTLTNLNDGNSSVAPYNQCRTNNSFDYLKDTYSLIS